MWFDIKQYLKPKLWGRKEEKKEKCVEWYWCNCEEEHSMSCWLVDDLYFELLFEKVGGFLDYGNFPFELTMTIKSWLWSFLVNSDIKENILNSRSFLRLNKFVDFENKSKILSDNGRATT